MKFMPARKSTRRKPVLAPPPPKPFVPRPPARVYSLLLPQGTTRPR